MRRWTFWICLVLGLLLLLGGWLVPAHLRAVDLGVIEAAGRNAGRSTPGLVESGLALAKDNNLGSAQMLLTSAQTRKVIGRDKLVSAVNRLAGEHPAWQSLGGPDPRLEGIFKAPPASTNSVMPFTDLLLRADNHDRAMAYLEASPLPAVQEMLRCRALTNTAIFSPSQSSSGQTFDAALAVCGLLLESGHLTRSLSNAVSTLATAANSGGGSERFEQVLLDFMSLGQRFDWNQLVYLTRQIDDPETLRLLANSIRQAAGREPVIFSAIHLSGKPAAVVGYLMTFSQSGLADLDTSLRYGSGGVRELLRRNLRLYDGSVRRRLALYDPFGAFLDFATDYCWRTPAFALSMKWVLYLAAGFLLAAAFHYSRPPVSVLERPLQVRGFHLAREFLFALGFLLVVLLLSEPFLAQDSQKTALPFRLHLPMAGGAATAGNPGAKSPLLNQMNILTMLLFFVLQALLYVACLVKLAEIRRQRVQSRIKIRLLENEDHLFDAGLYLGFLGTIVSFILSSVSQAHQFSLMVAYSSTSFGILFVSFFKIFHLRPLRRKLVLESEVESVAPVAAAARPLAQTL